VDDEDHRPGPAPRCTGRSAQKQRENHFPAGSLPIADRDHWSPHSANLTCESSYSPLAEPFLL
jgi:hypothetical protein